MTTHTLCSTGADLHRRMIEATNAALAGGPKGAFHDAARAYSHHRKSCEDCGCALKEKS